MTTVLTVAGFIAGCLLGYGIRTMQVNIKERNRRKTEPFKWPFP